MTELERLLEEVDTYEEDKEALVNGNIFYVVHGANWNSENGTYNDEIMCPGDLVSAWHAVSLENRGLLGILGLNSKALAESQVQQELDRDDEDDDYDADEEEVIPVLSSTCSDARVVDAGDNLEGLMYANLLLMSKYMHDTNKKFVCISNLVNGNTIEIDSTKNVPVKMLAEIVDVLRDNGYEASVENKYTLFDKMETYNSDGPEKILNMKAPKNIYKFDGIMFNIGDELVGDVDKLYEVGEKIKNIIKEYY